MSWAVVVVARNEERMIESCLSSAQRALRAVGGGDVILVDAGSQDRTALVARSMVGVQVLQLLEPPFHAAVGRNVGLKHARADMVQFLDGDMVIANDWLWRAQQQLLQGDVDGVDGWLSERDLEQKPLNATFGLDWPRNHGAIDRMGGASAWRRTSLLALGGFDESLLQGEDPDLSLRARQKGMRLLRLPAEMASHDLALEGLRDWWRRAASVGRSRLEIAQRHSVGAGPLNRAYLEAALHALAIATALFWPLAALLWASAVLAQVTKLAVRDRRRGYGWRASFIHAAHLLVVPIPTAIGALAQLFRRPSTNLFRAVKA